MMLILHADLQWCLQFFGFFFSFFFEQGFAIIFYLSRLRVKQRADPFFEITFSNSGGLLIFFFFPLKTLDELHKLDKCSK